MQTNSLTSKSILEQFNLNGFSEVVAGGNRGLGLEIAKALAEAGATIVIAARDRQTNIDSEELIRSEYKVTCISVPCDVTQEEDVSALTEVAESEFGKIDILINSAGINIRGAIEDLSKEEFEKVIHVNVTGAGFSIDGGWTLKINEIST